MKILIAEDDAISRRLLETILRKWGYDVVVAYDGGQAWEELQKEDAPTLIFKGGTSLSKAFGAIRRFSEDIDLSFDRADLGYTGDRDPEKEGISKKATGKLIEITGLDNEVLNGSAYQFSADGRGDDRIDQDPANGRSFVDYDRGLIFFPDPRPFYVFPDPELPPGYYTPAPANGDIPAAIADITGVLEQDIQDTVRAVPATWRSVLPRLDEVPAYLMWRRGDVEDCLRRALQA